MEKFIKQILQTRDHPLTRITEIFSKHFDKAYSQYTKPQSDAEYHRLHTKYKEKSQELKNDYIRRQTETEDCNAKVSINQEDSESQFDYD